MSDLVQLGQLTLGIVGAIIAAGLTGWLAAPQFSVPILSAIAAITATLSILWALRAKRRIRAALKTDWNPWIWVMERHSLVTVYNSAAFTLNGRMKIRILQHDVNRINLRVGWTGRGRIDVKLGNKGFTYTLEGTNHDFNRALVIHFDRPRAKGEELDLEFSVETEAEAGFEPQPYYALTLTESRMPETVSVKVDFDKALTVSAVQREVYASDSALWPLEPPEPVELDKEASTEWSLPRHRGQRYCIRWELG